MAARTLRSFLDVHAGEEIVVCGCGVSARGFVPRPGGVTIGVNDVGRLFDPTYLVVVNPRSQFAPERFRYVRDSNARFLFTHLALGEVRPPVVRFALGRFAGTGVSPEALHYTQNSPYVAVCLAAHLGASRIGLIGVDFTDDHFFGRTGVHPLSAKLGEIDRQYGQLHAALAARGVELVNLSGVSRLASLPRLVPAPTPPSESGAAPDAGLEPPPGVAPPSGIDRPRRTAMHVGIENRLGGPLGALLDTLARSAAALGHRVTRGPQGRAAGANLSIVWNGRHYANRVPALYCEHGWLPRSAYQISPHGINASSHCAPFEWDGRALDPERSAALDAHLAVVRAECLAAESSVGGLERAPPEFLLVPLQMEFDTNIVWHAPPELRSMQALVDYVSRLAPPWPVVFKQHPADARRANHHLRLRMRRRQDQLWSHASASVHALLRSGGCRGIVTINSNVAHDGLLWDVPALVLGRNVWPSSGEITPFLVRPPGRWDELPASARAGAVVECRRAYASFLVSQQWTLDAAGDLERVDRLLHWARSTRATARPGTPRSYATTLPPRREPAAFSRPVVNVVAENRGWLFELWKQRFRSLTRRDVTIVVSDRPLRNVDAWTFIRAREARATPDPARTVVQIHDLLGGGAYAEDGERSAVRECGALLLAHASQRDVLAAAGVALDGRACTVQPVGHVSCPRAMPSRRRAPSVAWVGRPALHGGEDLSRLDFFLEAAASFEKGTRVVLIGERLGTAAAALKRRGIDCVAHGTSRHPLQTCSQWIREFDCVAITSEADAGPWPLFDALHAGVPVVARPVGWARDLLASGTCGRLVEEPRAMGESIADVLAARSAWAARHAQLCAAVARYGIETWLQASLALALGLVAAPPVVAARAVR